VWLGDLEATQADSCGELMGLTPVYTFVCEVMCSLEPAELTHNVVSLRKRYGMGEASRLESISRAGPYETETRGEMEIDPVSMWEESPSMGW
jgi:hypothetical protein